MTVRLPGRRSQPPLALTIPSHACGISTLGIVTVLMTIRQYNDANLESIVGLFTATVRQVNIRDYSSEQVAAWAPQPPDLARWRERLTNLTLWVAESENQIIGFCGLGADGHIDLLYVDHRFQRQGVARHLYHQVETEARRRGLPRLFTEASITARPFFEHIGFECLQAQNVDLRGVLFQNFRMEKHLTAPDITPKPTPAAY